MKYCQITLMIFMVPFLNGQIPTSMASYNLGDKFVPPKGATADKDLKGDALYSIERKDGGHTIITVGPDGKIFRIMLSYPHATPAQEEVVAEEWLSKYDHFRCNRKGQPELHDGKTLASLYSHKGSVWIKIKKFPTSPGLPRTFAGHTLGKKFTPPKGIEAVEYDGGWRYRMKAGPDGFRAEIYTSKDNQVIYEIHAFKRKIAFEQALALRDEYVSKYRVYLEKHTKRDTSLAVTFASPQTQTSIDWSGKFMDVRLTDLSDRGYKIN